MKWLILVPLCFGLFLVEDNLHKLYIQNAKFEPARLEWEEAHIKGDREAMWKAFDKERRAHERYVDWFWFLHNTGGVTIR